MDAKRTSTLWQGATSQQEQSTRAKGRQEEASERICLLPGACGAVVRFGLTLLTRLDMLWRFNGSIRGSWLGQPVVVPFIFGNGIQHVHSSERWMFHIIQQLLKQTSGAFVDVGANIGQTLLKVKMADPSRRYYGFEPNPVAVGYLQQLMARNAFSNATIFPVGLSNQAAVVTLFLKDDADPSASIVTGFRRPERYSATQGVSVHRGDEVFGQIEDLRIGVLKIDVEGAELDVIGGCEETIARDKPFILCEVLPVYDPSSETGQLRLSRQQKLRALLQRLGYELYRRNRRGAFEKVDDFPVDDDIDRCNYLFLPHGSSTAALQLPT